ncbi:hypothetical protein WH158_15285 [Gluconobacter cerinus]|uniref:hypothetical protein n=1 Tax=Gluconobacter cerinus TaxID=38307 RepID=UPI0030AF15E5
MSVSKYSQAVLNRLQDDYNKIEQLKNNSSSMNLPLYQAITDYYEDQASVGISAYPAEAATINFSSDFSSFVARLNMWSGLSVFERGTVQQSIAVGLAERNWSDIGVNQGAPETVTQIVQSHLDTFNSVGVSPTHWGGYAFAAMNLPWIINGTSYDYNQSGTQSSVVNASIIDRVKAIANVSLAGAHAITTGIQFGEGNENAVSEIGSIITNGLSSKLCSLFNGPKDVTYDGVHITITGSSTNCKTVIENSQNGTIIPINYMETFDGGNGAHSTCFDKNGCYVITKGNNNVGYTHFLNNGGNDTASTIKNDGNFYEAINDYDNSHSWSSIFLNVSPDGSHNITQQNRDGSTDQTDTDSEGHIVSSLHHNKDGSQYNNSSSTPVITYNVPPGGTTTMIPTIAPSNPQTSVSDQTGSIGGGGSSGGGGHKMEMKSVIISPSFISSDVESNKLNLQIKASNALDILRSNLQKIAPNDNFSYVKPYDALRDYQNALGSTALFSPAKNSDFYKIENNNTKMGVKDLISTDHKVDIVATDNGNTFK